MSTKLKGNKAVSIIMSRFIINDIPIALPFGDNEKYDLIVDTKDGFKSIQVKYGHYSNGCVIADTRHRIGSKRIEYETYKGKVDFIAIWCEELNTSYLIPIEYCDKIITTLRIEPPKNNSCISKVVWASEYEFDKVLRQKLI